MNNLQQPAFPTQEAIELGNHIIAEFMPNMVFITPANKEYKSYWRKIDKEGLPIKDYKGNRPLDYHHNWNALKSVVDHLFTYSLAFRYQTEKLRETKIVVDIIPCWQVCIDCIIAIKHASQ